MWMQPGAKVILSARSCKKTRPVSSQVGVGSFAKNYNVCMLVCGVCVCVCVCKRET